MSVNVEYSEDKKKFEKKMERFSAHKKRTMDFCEYIKKHNVHDFLDDFGKQGSRVRLLQDCHSYMIFRDYFEKGVIKLDRTTYCNQSLLCPQCAIKRGIKHVQNYRKKFEVIKVANEKLFCYYIVFTIKNAEDLKERYLHLTDSFKKLMERRRTNNKKTNVWDRYKNSSLINAIAGVYSVEVKRGKFLNLWHPHMNLFLVMPEMLDYKKIRDEWKEVTKDSLMMECRLIPESKVLDSFVEILKYATKFSELSFEDNIEAYRVLSRRKLVGSFGEFRGLKIDENGEIEDLGAFVELFYRFMGKMYEKQEKKQPDSLKRDCLGTV
jgi:hypothetical protein